MPYRPKNLRRLIEAYRDAKAGRYIKTGIWTDSYWTPEDFFRWFRQCLRDKVNSKDPAYIARSRFRKFSPDYERALSIAATYSGNRIVIEPDRFRTIADTLGERIAGLFEHRVRNGWDD